MFASRLLAVAGTIVLALRFAASADAQSTAIERRADSVFTGCRHAATDDIKLRQLQPDSVQTDDEHSTEKNDTTLVTTVRGSGRFFDLSRSEWRTFNFACSYDGKSKRGWGRVDLEPRSDKDGTRGVSQQSIAPIVAAAVAPRDPDAHAASIEAQMTDDERFSMLISVIGSAAALGIPRDSRIPRYMPMSAGYTPGVARLGVPPILSSDAGMGITNPGYRPDDKGATALPASILVGATFNPELARLGGVVIGREARVRGFNAVLAGGINLTRDARNGRNFEYYSEDPWHSALMAAEAVRGIQSQRVISTLKHYVFNDNETNRHWLNAVVDYAANRESDLLAFQIAIERAQPGAIMCGYNKVNGLELCGNRLLLDDVLKRSWGYKGWVMSDWGATPRWDYALAGLDQESGVQLDVKMWGAEAFTDSLRAAYAAGRLPKERLSDMVRRMLRSMFAVGLDRWESAPRINMASHDSVALETARQGIVLLKNDGVLPLASTRPARVAVIGGYAQWGVPTGVGSGAVLPVGGYAAVVPVGGGGGMLANARHLHLLPSSPVSALKKLLPGVQIDVDPGTTPAAAAIVARRADAAVVFAVRMEGEGADLPDLSLPWGQDAMIDAVASANPNTIVVLETGNPVTMPWRDKARAILEAWYPGQAGGVAIAEILAGVTSPSGRLPITFPAAVERTPRPELPVDARWGTPVTIRYDEGGEAGYRWYARERAAPLYPFGYGLTYTAFSYSGFSVEGGETVTATFTVRNIGGRAGADVPQLYLVSAPDGARLRLLGFERVMLEPGASTTVKLRADPRLLARFDAAAGKWRIARGQYRIALARSATDTVATAVARMPEWLFGR